MKSLITRSFVALCLFAVMGCDMPPDSALKIGNDDIDDFDNGGDKETEAPETDSDSGNVDTDEIDTETETATDDGTDDGTDTDTDTDTATDTATDTFILEECIYDCTMGSECQDQNGRIHDEMLCDNRLVCCETGVYKAMWTCMICG